MERVENLIRLLLARGVGAVTIHRLLQHFGNADAVLGANESQWQAVAGVKKQHISGLHEAVDIDPRPELQKAADAGVTVIAYDDPQYPAPLREIYDPPCLLYVRGETLPSDAVGTAIVGTRRASRYGREQAERFGGQLARTGFCVVSGLARGIDTFAHRGALSAGGRTIAVIGCGMSHMYPPENRDLATEIAGQGAVITEFPMDTQPEASNFPRRNRIIAGLSLGVLVVEAPTRSGALITARLATEMGREVFAIPGRIDQDVSSGCHAILRDGATLVRNIDDILAEYGPVADSIAGGLKTSASRSTVEDAENTPLPHPADDKEAKILAALSSEPTHIDHVCAATGLPVHQVSSTLMMLELKRQVRQEPGKFFVRISR